MGILHCIVVRTNWKLMYNWAVSMAAYLDTCMNNLASGGAMGYYTSRGVNLGASSLTIEGVVKLSHHHIKSKYIEYTVIKVFLSNIKFSR